MDWEKVMGTVLNSSTFANIAGGSKSPKPAPAVAAPVITVQNPIEQGMSKTTMALIGAGILAVVVALFAFRK